MKHFIIAALTGLALVGTVVNAEDTKIENANGTVETSSDTSKNPITGTTTTTHETTKKSADGNSVTKHKRKVKRDKLGAKTLDEKTHESDKKTE